MSSIVAQIHIDTTAGAPKPLPVTPIPFPDNASAKQLAPSTQLRVRTPSTSSSTKATNRPQRLSDLADAMEATRASLNQVLTSWKDWAGKEDAAAIQSRSAKKDAEEEDDDGEDDDEDEEQ